MKRKVSLSIQIWSSSRVKFSGKAKKMAAIVRGGYSIHVYTTKDQFLCLEKTTLINHVHYRDKKK